MKIVNGIAHATTTFENIALKVLKYDLFDNESKYPDWNAGKLNIEDAIQYMITMYKDLYFNNPDVINPEFEVYPYDLATGEATVAVSYYREPNEFEQPQRIIDDKEVVYSTDVVGRWIPSNYQAIMAGYKMFGKHRKYAKKLGVAYATPLLHLFFCKLLHV